MEILRRAGVGVSLARSPMVAHPLDDVALLIRLKLLSADLDGNVRLTELGSRCLETIAREDGERPGFDIFESADWFPWASPPWSRGEPSGADDLDIQLDSHDGAAER
jgi:hypothetical protein